MQYFVSAEDTVYHHWQLEILLESFRKFNAVDDLVIGMATNTEPKPINFVHNLKTHKNIFKHENLGRKRNYLPINRPYAIYTALTQGLITQPFALIEPDMVLIKPIQESNKNISFQINPLLTEESAVRQNSRIINLIKDIIAVKKMKEENFWIPLGSTMVFNNLPNDFFKRVVEWIEILEYENRKADRESWWHTEKVGWILTMLEFNGHVSYQGKYDYEMVLIDSGITHNLIHYQKGLPPNFNKKMFTYKPPFYFGMGNPFEVIKSHNPTSTTNRLIEVVDSYLSKKKNFEISDTVGEVIVTKKPNLSS